jgi:hypothetical protein
MTSYAADTIHHYYKKWRNFCVSCPCFQEDFFNTLKYVLFGYRVNWRNFCVPCPCFQENFNTLKYVLFGYRVNKLLVYEVLLVASPKTQMSFSMSTLALFLAYSSLWRKHLMVEEYKMLLDVALVLTRAEHQNRVVQRTLSYKSSTMRKERNSI